MINHIFRNQFVSLPWNFHWADGRHTNACDGIYKNFKSDTRGVSQALTEMYTRITSLELVITRNQNWLQILAQVLNKNAWHLQMLLFQIDYALFFLVLFSFRVLNTNLALPYYGGAVFRNLF